MCYHVRLLHGKVIDYSAGSTGFLIPFTKKFYRSCPQSGVQNWMIQWSSHLHIDLFFSITWFPKVTNIKLFFQFLRFVSHSVFVWFSFLFLLLLGRRVSWINILYNFNRRPRLYSLFFSFNAIPAFQYKDETWHQSARFQNRWLPFSPIWIMFTHLKSSEWTLFGWLLIGWLERVNDPVWSSLRTIW